MADEKALAILRQGVEAWNQWRETLSSEKIDLSAANLSGAFLRWAFLSGAFLSGADLSRADLSRAFLSGADLRGAFLHKADLSGADLSGAFLSGAFLSGAFLSGADLSGAFLSGANLSGADLSGAFLSGANLSQLKVLGTNFTSANLTGACIEDWHINSETNLTDVICKHIYLKQEQQERRPSDPTVNFARGDFVRLVQKSLETVDLIFADGIDWTAFLSSFNELKAKYGKDNLAVQAIEKKTGGSFVIRLEVPPEANKAEIERQAKESYENNLKLLETRYHKELQAKEEQIVIYRQHNTFLEKIIDILANRPIQNIINNLAQSESKSVSESSSSNRNITTGDITASEGGIVNLGELSGTVRTTINKLPSSPEPGKPGIKELLEQLKTIVESENRLSNQDKAEALEFIQTIAEAGQNPQDSGVQKIVKAPIRALKGILSSLPDVAKLAEAANTLIPLIAKMFGLP